MEDMRARIARMSDGQEVTSTHLPLLALLATLQASAFERRLTSRTRSRFGFGRIV